MAGAPDVPFIQVVEEDDVFTGLLYTQPMFPMSSSAENCIASRLACDFSRLKERKQSTSTPVTSRSDVKYGLAVSMQNDSGIDCALNLSESCLSEAETSMSISTTAGSFTDTHVTYSGIGLSLGSVSLSRRGSICSPARENDCTSFDSGVESMTLSSDTSSVFHSDSPSLVENRRVLSSWPSDKAAFTRVMEKFSPGEPDRLIGRKMGLEQVDILTELDVRNISCVNLILKMLSIKDLCSMCLVSKQWRSLCHRDWTANSRRLQHMVDMATTKGKENKSRSSPRKQQRKREERRVLQRTQTRGLTPSSSPLKVVQVTGSFHPQSPTKQVSKMKLFIDEASKLKNDESLRKCPRCQSPAKVHTVQERACCTNRRCSYDFCIKCRNDYHGNKECTTTLSKKTKTDMSINSRKSKRNLRRL